LQLPPGLELVAAEIVSPLTRHELRALLDEELNRLPEKYRAPLVLHYLESKTVEQTAAELGWPYGTVCVRLTRGKDRLRIRLAKRGMLLSTGAVTAALTGEATAAALSPGLAFTTLQFVRSGVASHPATTLAHDFVRSEALTRLKWTLGLLLLAGTAAAGTGVMLSRDQPEATGSAGASSPHQGAVAVRPTRVDQDGDPLPEGAVVRLGSARFRGGATHAAFSADGRTLTTIGGSARTWDAMTGRPLVTTYHPDLRAGCALSGDGRIAATQEYMVANLDPLHGQIRLRHVPSMALHRVLEVPGMGGALQYCISYDGTRVAAGGRFEILVWDAQTGAIINRLPLTPKDYPSSCRVALSPDGKLVTAPDACSSGTNAIRLWEVDSGNERKPLTIPGTRFTQ
jgi:hypothetical protein